MSVDSDGDQEMKDSTRAATNGSEHDEDIVNGISRTKVQNMLSHWSQITAIDTQKLLYTSYRKVESDVGKKKQSDVERVAGLASTLGGGW
jgi:hypothetical protein